MECGAWVNDNPKVPYVIRIRGCEFGIHGADLSELISHLVAVRDGAKESVSAEYRDLKIKAKNEAKPANHLLKMLAERGLVLPAAPPRRQPIPRRI